MVGRGVGLEGILEGQPEDLVDHLPACDVLPVDERHRDTAGARSSGASDAMEVGLLIVRALVVDDVGDSVDVDAACRDIGGDEHIDLAIAEGAQGLLARSLAEIAMDGPDGETALGEFIGDLLCLALGAREDHCESTAIGLQDAGEQLDLVHGVRPPHVLLDGIDGGAVVTRISGADMGRLRHVSACEGDDLPGHGCREEHRLSCGGQLRDEALDVG